MASIDGIQQSSQQLTPGGGLQAGVQAQAGTYRGEQVMVEDGASILADAAEELSFYAAEAVEDKTLEERSVDAELPLEVMKLEEINAYLEAAKAFDDPKKLADLAKRMQSGQENPQELARRESRDPTRQYVLLQFALQDGIQNGASATALDNLRDALADLEIEHGPQIRAGLNTIGAAAEVGADGTAIEAFQGTYRDVVLGEASLNKTLALVVERHSGPDGADFKRGLQAMIKAAGQDLAAARPSTDPTRLQALVQDLYQLEVTATVMEGCQALAQEMLARHDCSGVQPLQMMKDLVAITGEKWVSSSRFSGMAEKFGVREAGPQIAYLAATKNLLREMPVKVFPDADTRRTALDASQEALDQAIDREEE